MRRFIVSALVLTVTLAAGMRLGALLQQLRTGYVYKIRRQSHYELPVGQLRWEYATESFGAFPVMDPGTCSILLRDRAGQEFTLYKARCAFQESEPYFETVAVSNDEIQWDDGCFRYTLRLEPSARTDQSGAEN